MTNSVHGIHHVTCIAGNAQENLDFYAGLLGMRLVKKSVNQDDPGTYHLFYADRVGNPGTDFIFCANQAKPHTLGKDCLCMCELPLPKSDGMHTPQLVF